MITSKQTIKMIKKFEGLRLSAYRDIAGYVTVGWGHKMPAKSKYNKITIGQALQYFDEDLKKIEYSINQLKLGLNQNQFDAIVSLTFNIGIGNLLKSTLLKKIRANKNDKSISNEIMKWCHVKNKTIKGLYNRRYYEANKYFEKSII